jgi:hypothetical protein
MADRARMSTGLDAGPDGGPDGGGAPRPFTAGLPRRDLILLPAVAVLAVLLVGLVLEGAARLVMPEQRADACLIMDTRGGHYQPNCRSTMKLAEGEWVASEYNDCGYRADRPCRGGPADALRVAVLGTSISRGFWVDFDDTFLGRVEHELTAACGRPVDVQNISQFGSYVFVDGVYSPVWHHVADRVGEALALRPDALVLTMTAYDLEGYRELPQLQPAGGAEHPTAPHESLFGKIQDAAKDAANDSRFILIARRYAFQDPDRYVLNYLQRGDVADYLRPPFSPNWRMRLAVADATIGRIAAKAAAAQVPLVVVLVPGRAQALLSRDGADRHQADPFALGQALAPIARAHRADFVDMTAAIRDRPDPGGLFFEIDTHPNPAGHAALARIVEQRLLADANGFASCKVSALDRPAELIR